jgi:hypothetical protein
MIRHGFVIAIPRDGDLDRPALSDKADHTFEYNAG